MKLYVYALLLLVLASCGSSSHIITGRARTPQSHSNVMLYLDPPKEFESIGIVDASVPQGFSRQATQNRLIDKLKKEAAKIGANGIILQNTGTEYSGTTGYTINGIYNSQTSEKNVARGRAIYVTKE